MNPRATLTYSLVAGAPSGATIDPITGTFTWSVPTSQAPGDYPVTISVIDNDTPPNGDTASFTIVVQQATSLTAITGKGTFAVGGKLTATLASGSQPLAGKTISFTLDDGGTSTPVGTAVTNAQGIATVVSVSLAGFDPGAFSGAVVTSFAGDSTDAPSSGSGELTVNTLTTYMVDSLADQGAGSGLVGDLRYAISQANANPGSDIAFAVTGTIQLLTPLPNLTADVTINGPGATLLIVSGATTSVLTFDSGVTANLSGLTLSGGSAEGGIISGTGTAASENGGAIVNQGALTVTDCIISGNRAGAFGGGIYNSGTLTVTDSTITGNQAAQGGGIYNGALGTATVTDSIISGNGSKSHTPSGGGLETYGAMTMSNCTISGNTAYKGGGIAVVGGHLTLTNSTISGNDGTGSGGGIWSYSALTMSGCSVESNYAYFRGGGLYNSGLDGPTTLTDCTVINNTAGLKVPNARAGGGGIANVGSTLTLIDSVITGNAALNGGGLDNYGTTANLDDCTLSNNTAKANGGGINDAGFYVDIDGVNKICLCSSLFIKFNDLPKFGPVRWRSLRLPGDAQLDQQHVVWQHSPNGRRP